MCRKCLRENKGCVIEEAWNAKLDNLMDARLTDIDHSAAGAEDCKARPLGSTGSGRLPRNALALHDLQLIIVDISEAYRKDATLRRIRTSWKCCRRVVARKLCVGVAPLLIDGSEVPNRGVEFRIRSAPSCLPRLRMSATDAFS